MAFVLRILALLTIVASVVMVNPTGRIVGGYDATRGQFPYQISLRMDQRHACGGSIISNKYILTAAHCVVKKGIEPSNRIAGGVLVPVKRVIVHQGYNNVFNDLALLELAEELQYSEYIQPIPLAEEDVPDGEEVIISGWGLTVNAADSLPIILQWNRVEALSKRRCATKILIASDALICLNHPKGAGACGGDSGGPAVYDGKLVGVAGFVVITCGSSRPDGYAKVAYNIEWIKQNMS